MTKPSSLLHAMPALCVLSSCLSALPATLREKRQVTLKFCIFAFLLSKLLACLFAAHLHLFLHLGVRTPQHLLWKWDGVSPSRQTFRQVRHEFIFLLLYIMGDEGGKGEGDMQPAYSAPKIEKIYRDRNRPARLPWLTACMHSSTYLPDRQRREGRKEGSCTHTALHL